MAELATKPISKLSKIVNLLDAFHENDILYCHWKSNEHLGASMTGDTDLDILFDKQQKVKIESILKNLDFKLFESIKQKQYKDIVDFIGLDLQSGKVVHLHTHYRLTMGEPYLKGYQFDFEEKILNSRIYNEDYGIYCIDPSFELVLLYLRESLKVRHRDILRFKLKKKTDYNESILREYNWLKPRISDSQVHVILDTIFSNQTTFYNLVTTEFNRHKLHELAPAIKKEFSENRLYTPARALFIRWYREATILVSKRLAHFLARPIVSKRINPRGGVIVAIIGADGSGKTTVTNNLRETFEQKLDIYNIYFGRGDGNKSLIRKLLSSVRQLLIPKKKNKIENGQTGVSNKNIGFVRSTYKCINALLVAQEKRSNLKQMNIAKKRGLLVICDRYPQNQVMGHNDGPLLHDLLESKNPLFRAAAKKESKIYAMAENNPPDIVFKLIAEAEVVEARKPGETSLAKLESKITGIKQLNFKGNCKVITVNGSLSLSEVLYTIKKETWQML